MEETSPVCPSTLKKMDTRPLVSIVNLLVINTFQNRYVLLYPKDYNVPSRLSP